MPALSQEDIPIFYKGFDAPISGIDCGEKCAPYNEGGVPFCCDTRHAIPTAYDGEWDYLQAHTDLWHLWQTEDGEETARMQSQTPSGQVLIECLGHKSCQRPYRTLTCRAFPFFPYIDRAGIFLGLSYYWQYEERCWVISHLETVTHQYIIEFMRTYQKLFQLQPVEMESFRHHSMIMRRIFGRKHRAIPLINSNGHFYKITPSNGRMRRSDPACFTRFEPYRFADKIPFPDEIP